MFVAILVLSVLTSRIGAGPVSSYRGTTKTLTCSKSRDVGAVMWDKSGSQTFAVYGEIQAGVNASKYSVAAVGSSFSLTIKDLVPSDDGTYRCYNMFQSATSETHTLTVFVDPQALNVSTDRLPTNEGTNANLVCMSPSGKPKTTLTWHRKGDLSTDLGGTSIDINNADGTFTARKTYSPKVTRDMLGAVFVCKAVTTELNYDANLEIPLDINLKPVQPKITGNNVTVAGRQLTLKCLAAGGKPAAEVKWWLGGNVISGSVQSSFNGLGTYNVTNTITIATTWETDGLEYVCTANNSVLVETGLAALETRITIGVLHKPILVPSNATQDADEGQSVTVPCPIRSNPPPRILWFRNNQLINVNESRYTGGTPTTPDLTIGSVGGIDAGVYKCTARNYLGVATSPEVKMIIRHTPLISIGPSNPAGVKEGQDITLECRIVAHPPELQYVKWFLGGIEVDVQNPRYTVGSRTLKITKLMRSDRTYVTCKAKNAVGEGSSPNTLLQAEYAPEKVEMSHVYLNVTERIVPSNITCLADAAPTPLYAWELRGTVVSTGSVLAFPQGITGDDMGEYTCRATNKWGQLANTTTLDVIYAPMCLKTQKTKYAIGQGKSIPLKCYVHGNPSDISMTWAFSGSSWDRLGAKVAEAIRPDVTVMSTLDVTPKNSAQYGVYTCTASNSHGTSRQPCNIELVVAAAPEKPRSCHVTNTTGSSLSVSCVAGFDGGSTQRFAIQLKMGDAYETKVNQTTPIFAVEGLISQTNYTLRVCASNIEFWDTLVCSDDIEANTLECKPGETCTDNTKSGAGSVLYDSLSMFCLMGLVTRLIH